MSEQLPELAEDVSGALAELRQVGQAAANALVAVALLSLAAVFISAVTFMRVGAR